MYRVFTLEFKTFNEVVDYAWNTYKIDANFIQDMTPEDIRQQACEQLTQMVAELERETHAE